jgi:hypothetical protein
MAKQLVQDSNKKVVDGCSNDHGKTLITSNFKEGEKVPLRVKDIEMKNRKLCEEKYFQTI